MSLLSALGLSAFAWRSTNDKSMKQNAANRIHWLALGLVFMMTSAGPTARAQEPQSEKPATREGNIIESGVPGAKEILPEIEIEKIRRGQIVLFGQDVHLKQNEECREIVVIGGDAVIDGSVRGDVVVVFGSCKVTGTIRGDLVTILGPADLNGEVRGSFVNVLGTPTLGPKAIVERDALAVGGKLNLDPGAFIRGPRHEFAIANSFQWLGDWFRGGFLRARPLPPKLTWAWTVTSIFLLIYFLMAILFPRPLRACVNTLDDAPVAAFFVGLLGLMLFLPVMVLLAFTIVGVPLLLLSLVAAIFFGKVAIYQFTGTQLGRQLNLAPLQLPLVALAIGAVIFGLLYTVPILGFFAWGVGVVWGVGAVLMATFANFRSESKPIPTVAVPSSSIASTPGAGVPPALEGANPPIPPLSAPIDFVQFERAGFWIRAFATIIDLLLIGVTSLFLGHGISFPFFMLFYHVGMWTWKGTTIGGIVFGLKIVRMDGRSIDFAVALIRSLFSIISFVFFFIGFFWAGWDREKQSWHDKIAGTVIVKVPKGISLV